MRLRRPLIAAVLIAVPFIVGARTAESTDGTDPSGANPPVSIGTYQQRFVEEFDGTAINKTNWAVYNSPTSTKPQGPKCSCLAILDSGVLHLRVAQVNGVWMGSGMSAKAIHATYGRFLVRARYSNGYGAKAVALLWPEVGWPPEVDFIEFSASDPLHRKVWLTNHYSAANLMQHNFVNATACWHCAVIPGFDPAQWHTYDVEWTQDAVSYRVDDQLVAVQSGHAPAQRMWLGLQNSLGRTAATRPNASTPPNVDFDVDWVDYLTQAA